MPSSSEVFIKGSTCKGIFGDGCGNSKRPQKHYCKHCTIERLIAIAKTKLRGAYHVKAFRKRQQHTESGYPGIHRTKNKAESWKGVIFHHGVRLGIGDWDTPFEAHEVRMRIMAEIGAEIEVDNPQNQVYSNATQEEIHGNTSLERAVNFIDSTWMKAIID